MNYKERDEQVALFRKPADEGGATYLIATDAAGEGINLQVCWLMVNYDIPWNPARLEQRMGRIHRFGQTHDPVIILNLVAGKTREGRVMKTLLEKLERIRRELTSDKVFDVIGRLFEGVSLRAYMEQAAGGTEDESKALAQRIEGTLTKEQVKALEAKQRSLYANNEANDANNANNANNAKEGDSSNSGGSVQRALPRLNATIEQETYRRLLPGYVRRFLEKAAPLVDIGIEGTVGSADNIDSMDSGGNVDAMGDPFALSPAQARCA